MNKKASEKNYDIMNSVANRNYKVLIADDNALDRLIVSTTLMQMGFKQIFEAENGQIAQYKIENAISTKNQFDLIILDWEMPQMNGIRLLRMMRSEIQTRDTSVLMLTASPNIDRVTEALEAGVNQFVVKPINPRDFCHKISELLKVAKRA